MKKKVIAILLSAVTALSMIGCGGGSDAPAAGGDGAESLGGSVEGELSIAIWDEGKDLVFRKSLMSGVSSQVLRQQFRLLIGITTGHFSKQEQQAVSFLMYSGCIQM